MQELKLVNNCFYLVYKKHTKEYYETLYQEWVLANCNYTLLTEPHNNYACKLDQAIFKKVMKRYYERNYA
jgi:hypothetical protein